MDLERAAVVGRVRQIGLPNATRLRHQIYFLLLVTDLLCIAASFAISTLGRFYNLHFPDWEGLGIATVGLYAVLAFNGGAYSLDALRSPRAGLRRAVGALTFTFVIILVLVYFLRADSGLSRSLFAAVVLLSCALLAISRRLVGMAVQRRTGGAFVSEVLILDDVQPIAASERVAQIDARAENLKPNLRDPMMLHRFATALSGVDRVIIACKPEDKARWAMVLKGANLRGEVVAPEYDAMGAIGVASVGQCTTLVVATGPLSMQNRIIKRVLDLVICLPLLAALAPLLVLTAIAIKLDSPGPILFRQKRVGRGNALFEIYKFRSMRSDRLDSDGTTSARRDDDRITRVGKIIRRTSIDELPQLLNVLLGSMSVVGPRPHALGSLAGERLFWEVDERYWHRHALKPGITGLAQVRGFRGATHRTDDLTRRLQADLEYISGWSVWRDIGIILSTVKVIVHKNAY